MHRTSIRLISGIHGGRKLSIPKDLCHPMGERERNALFNKLDSLISLRGIYVLDLFSGSGALGLECLSRGAAHVVFVERNPI